MNEIERGGGVHTECAGYAVALGTFNVGAQRRPGLRDREEPTGALQRLHDQLLRVASGCCESFGNLGCGQAFVVVEAQHGSVPLSERREDAPREELALKALDGEGVSMWRELAALRVVQLVEACPHPQVVPAKIADGGDEPGARVLDRGIRAYERQKRILEDGLAVVVGDAELAGGDEEEEGSVLDIESADVEVRLAPAEGSPR